MIVLRVAKADSAYLYQLLESYEGLTNYSTLTTQKDLGYRDILIQSTPEQAEELQKVLARIQAELSLEFVSND
jgi:hypothetical protein